MPTENRSSNTEMVSVPREQLRQFIEYSASVCKSPAWVKDKAALLATLEHPVQQHQGEPVAFVRFRNGEPDYDRDDVLISNVPGDTLGDGDSWEPVYTHGDPAEVEQLRAELCERAGIIGRFTGERDALRGQLAEAQALLSDVLNASTPPGDSWLVSRIRAHLSASAEPSALPDPLGCNECTHAECGRFDGPRQVECRAMADNACARPGASS